MRERFGAADPRSLMLRFHAQTAGSTLTAQQPLNNVVRTTVEALAALLGGAQSLHTNGYDEALALPSEASAKLALRTQQILAHESGLAELVDPLGGAYAVEALTSEIESRARAYLDEIDRRGGMIAAIEQSFPQHEIERRAFEHQRALEEGRRVVVGQNALVDPPAEPPKGAGADAGAGAPALHHLDPAIEQAQVERLGRLRRARDPARAAGAIAALVTTARGGGNLLPSILEAVKARATLGEIADALRGVFGEHRPV
jgi:methylmalonyl-CoA mutase N-terminal domain/subunit